jgi:hypothetical protein
MLALPYSLSLVVFEGCPWRSDLWPLILLQEAFYETYLFFVFLILPVCPYGRDGK